MFYTVDIYFTLTATKHKFLLEIVFGGHGCIVLPKHMFGNNKRIIR